MVQSFLLFGMLFFKGSTSTWDHFFFYKFLFSTVESPSPNKGIIVDRITYGIFLILNFERMAENNTEHEG